MKILHIDSSVLGGQSITRDLSASIVDRLSAAHPGAEVIRHDLVADPIPELTGEHLAVIRKMAPPSSPALASDVERGDALIDELFAADAIVIGAPMYNFTVPTQLKAWIDRVLIAGRTFHYTADGPAGLLASGKKVYIASARGSRYANGSPLAEHDHHETYLKTALGFIGLTDVTVIRAEGVSKGEESKVQAISDAKAAVAALAA